MATIKIDTLSYNPLSSESPEYVAQFFANGGNEYQVDTTTAIKMSADAVPPNWLTVDNTQGAGYIFVSFNGNYQFSVLPYTRDRFALGKGTNKLVLTADVNVTSAATISISSAPLADSTANQYLIQQVAAQVTFPIGLPETASRVQAAGDNKNSVLFETTNTIPLTYSLMLASAAQIGWMQGVFNEPKVGNVGDVVTLVPSGTNLINGRASWVIPPGTGGFLMGSGIDWYFIGVDNPSLLSVGTAAAPAYSFFVDPDTGLYRSGANQVSVAVGGAETVRINSLGLQAPSGAVGTPGLTFLADPDTGFFSLGANQIGMALGGVQRASFANTFIFSPTGDFNSSPGGSFNLVPTGDFNVLAVLGGGVDIRSTTKTWLQFPSTPSPSTDPQTLDAYSETSGVLTLTATTGAFTTYAATYTAIKVGRACTLEPSISITNIGTATGLIFFAGAPYTSFGDQGFALCEITLTGYTCFFQMFNGGVGGVIRRYDNGTLLVNGYNIRGSGDYVTTS